MHNTISEGKSGSCGILIEKNVLAHWTFFGDALDVFRNRNRFNRTFNRTSDLENFWVALWTLFRGASAVFDVFHLKKVRKMLWW